MAAGRNWPTLVRHGTIFSLEKGRHACMAELFGAQGFPVHPLCGAKFQCGFQAFYEMDLTRAEAHKMIGNAMYLPTVGSMILYAMSSVEYQPSTIIRPMSRALSGFEDSQESLAN